MVFNLWMISNQVISDPATDSFIYPKPSFGNSPPLISTPLNTVHIDDIYLAFYTLNNIENSSIIAKSQYNTVMR
ncbi:hypothetical protein AO726_02335 [Pseudomonas sp. TTU2014-080ASC]|nr:hypothetical protein AO726_02335 [Pseudomonas sp. TTU2014-080ASC]